MKLDLSSLLFMGHKYWWKIINSRSRLIAPPFKFLAIFRLCLFLEPTSHGFIVITAYNWWRNQCIQVELQCQQ